MKLTIVACGLVWAMCAGALAAEPILRGSIDFHPSPDQPVGWRGDGSGRYPAAEPPLHWGRESKLVKELRCQAGKPKEGDTGQPMQLGVISQWAVLGPFDLPADFPEDKDLTTFVDSLFGDTHSLQPDVGEAFAGQKWKLLSIATSIINWSQVFNRDASKSHPPTALLAHTYVYSPTGGPIDVQIQSFVPLQCFVNGEPLFQSPKSWTSGYYRGASKVLKKGWNRVLLKLKPKPKQDNQTRNCDNWYSCISFFGAPSSEYETRNIAWISKIPAAGVSSPIVVGDKIFVTCEWCTLCCFNKADGKLLWVRSPTYYDAATDDERKASPEVFKEIAPLAEKLRQIDEGLPRGTPPRDDRLLLEKQIHKLMREASPQNSEMEYPYGPARDKYALPSMGEPGFASPTPVSDGQQVYAAFDTGVVACYDLNGNQKWVTWTPLSSTEHGCVHSPAIAGDRLILGKFQYESVALDTKTGREIWHNPWIKTGVLWRGSTVTMKAGGETYFVETGARISRVSDGKCVVQGDVKSSMVQVPTTILADNLLFELSSHPDVPSRIYTMPTVPSESSPPKLAKKIILDPPPTAGFPINVNYYAASPVYHEGLFYCVGDLGVLTVVDAKTGEIVYRQMLDADVYSSHRGGMGSSPTLAGKYIYLFGDQGTTLVIEPGRTYKQVAKNRVEYCPPKGHGQEIMESCPVFEGKRLFFRGSENLYCIEEK